MGLIKRKKEIVCCELDDVRICSMKSKSVHCRDACIHAHPHYPDGCERFSFCNCGILKRNIKVHCRKLNKQERNAVLEKIRRNQNWLRTWNNFEKE